MFKDGLEVRVIMQKIAVQAFEDRVFMGPFGNRRECSGTVRSACRPLSVNVSSICYDPAVSGGTRPLPATTSNRIMPTE